MLGSSLNFVFADYQNKMNYSYLQYQLKLCLKLVGGINKGRRWEKFPGEDFLFYCKKWAKMRVFTYF